MFSIKTAFGRAAKGTFGPGSFWLLLFAIVIVDDAQREKEERRKKRERESQPVQRHKRPSGPRRF